jgi:pimeloyl-ACP methyl ester carboxylesterase
MGIYESGVRTAWRAMMRVAEHRIGNVAELGRPLERAVDANPVLLVHGYGNNSGSMQAIERSLARDGFQVFSIDLPNFGFGDAMADAAVVKAKVAEILASTGATNVDLVGHSRGGLVSRAAQQLLDPDGAIGRVVTVSSANQGIYLGPFDSLGALALPEGMQQIRRGTELIDDLHRMRAGHDVLAVGTNGVDGVLVPASASRIEDAPFLAVDEGRTIGPLSRVGHYGILRDDRAYETIRGALLLPR